MIPASLLLKSRHHTNCTAVSSEDAAAAEGFSEADMASALAASEAEQSHQTDEDPNAPAADSYFYQVGACCTMWHYSYCIPCLNETV